MKLQIFMIKKIPKVDSNHTCSAVIGSDSALKKDENYYPLECKYIEKDVNRHVNDNFSDFPSSNVSDEE